MDETHSEDESLKTPEQQIRGMGKAILKAVDKITEEHGWSRSTDPFSLGRRFDPINFGSNFQPEAFCMAQVLEHGIIPKVQIPGKEPFPEGIIINLRGAPEFVDWHSEGTYREKTFQVVEELLQKLGFLEHSETIATSKRKKFAIDTEIIASLHPLSLKREYQIATPIGGKPYDASWIMGSNYEGQTITEIEHPTLPFVADILPQLDREPPLVFIRDISKSAFDRGAVEAAEEILEQGEPEEAKAVRGVERILEQSREEAAILHKMGNLRGLILQHPKLEPTPNLPKHLTGGRVARAELDNNSYIVVYDDGGGYLSVVDQKPPLKFQAEFLTFKDKELGAKHPYARGVRTDNLLIVYSRKGTSQSWEEGSYIIDPGYVTNPERVLFKLLPPEKMPQKLTQVELTSELDLVSSALDTLIE